MRREGQGRGPLDFVPSFVKSTPSGRQVGTYIVRSWVPELFTFFCQIYAQRQTGRHLYRQGRGPLDFVPSSVKSTPSAAVDRQAPISSGSWTPGLSAFFCQVYVQLQTGGHLYRQGRGPLDFRPPARCKLICRGKKINLKRGGGE